MQISAFRGQQGSQSHRKTPRSVKLTHSFLLGQFLSENASETQENIFMH